MQAEVGIPDRHIKKLKLGDLKEVCSFDPYQSIYAPYKHGVKGSIYNDLYKDHGSGHPFHQMQQLVIAMELVQEKKNSGGAGLDLDALVYDDDSDLIVSFSIYLNYPTYNQYV